MSYLVLRNISVRNANAQPSAWLIAPPSPTAFMGFAHALGRHLDAPAKTAAIVQHDFSLRAERIERRVLPHQFRGAGLINSKDYSSKNKYALSLQPSARCDQRVSLLVEFADDALIDCDAVRKWLPSARIAGGTIDEFARPVMERNLDAALKKVGNGWAVVERGDLMALQVGQTDRLDAFLAATSSVSRVANPWVVPALLGYRAITAPQERSQARDDYPHLFAEPLIGLARLPLNGTTTGPLEPAVAGPWKCPPVTGPVIPE